MKKNLIYVLLAAVFLSGCATVPRTAGPYPVSSVFEGQAVNLNNTVYVPLIVVCDRLDFKWSWDTVARKAGIQKKDLYVRFAQGSNFALVNDKMEKMQGPAILHEGALMVPISFVEDRLLPPELKSVQRAMPRPAVAITRQYLLKKVVIDPGHGGKDPGAIGRRGLLEKNVTLEIAKALKGKLQNEGFIVYLTRSDNIFIPLSKRPQIANDRQADIFVSIHANAARIKNANGFEVYYLAEAADESAKRLAQQENACLKFEQASYRVNSSGSLEAILWDLVSTENRAESIKLANYICSQAKNGLWVRQRGVKSAQFYVLKGARMPAVLIEVGFITNTDEEVKLNSDSYRDDVAQAIAQSLLNYREEYQSTEGFTK
jgi:N-acetylmuramoyl-L-alanine amidase